LFPGDSRPWLRCGLVSRARVEPQTAEVRVIRLTSILATLIGLCLGPNAGTLRAEAPPTAIPAELIRERDRLGEQAGMLQAQGEPERPSHWWSG
jgi:hypothetical protein